MNTIFKFASFVLNKIKALTMPVNYSGKFNNLFVSDSVWVSYRRYGGEDEKDTYKTVTDFLTF